MRKSINWCQKQDELIVQNYSTINSKKWKIIANILKQNGFFKKQTQCRERYINHLAPNLQRNIQITAEQLQTFYRKYEQYGPKWTMIQNFLPKKSQVQLKNIFYGNVRCFVKKIIKYFTNKTAVFVNKFDTTTLQNIYSGRKNYKGLYLIRDDIKKMKFRFNEDQCLLLIKQREENYKGLLNILLDQQQAKGSKHYDYFKRKCLKKLIIQPNNKDRSKRKSQQIVQIQLNIHQDQNNQQVQINQPQYINHIQNTAIQQISYSLSYVNNYENQNKINHQFVYIPSIQSQFVQYYPFLHNYYENMYDNQFVYNNGQELQAYNISSKF